MLIMGREIFNLMTDFGISLFCKQDLKTVTQKRSMISDKLIFYCMGDQIEYSIVGESRMGETHILEKV